VSAKTKKPKPAITVLTDEYWQLVRENESLKKVLGTLVDRYVANAGTESQFVACITPHGNMREWDDAMKALGRELHPSRKKPKS